jgi:cell division initiation protein
VLTPVDVENKVFKKAKLGGYDINDVEDFLEKLIVDYEAVFKELTELKDKCENLQESVKYYKSLEQGIEQSINNAKDEADRIKARAIEEAQEIRDRKEKEYKNRIAELDLEAKKRQYDLEEMKKEMQIYKIKVKSMLEAQIKILDED